MSSSYDKYYQQSDYFGEPLPQLIEYFSGKEPKPLLDLGCGQGRNAVPLTRLGFQVTGVDTSREGVRQMLSSAEKEKLSLIGEVGDIYKFSGFDRFQYILLDCMFHFYQKDKVRETSLINKILKQMKPGAELVVCILDKGQRVDILKATMADTKRVKQLFEKQASYHFADPDSNTSSVMPYKLVVAEVA